jgi:hypothetical protein
LEGLLLRCLPFFVSDKTGFPTIFQPIQQGMEWSRNGGEFEDESAVEVAKA